MPPFLKAILFCAIGVCLIIYALRSMICGKICLGVRGNKETWGDRNYSPEVFWVGIVGVAFAGCCCLAIAIEAMVDK
jgi:hypothetical protein